MSHSSSTAPSASFGDAGHTAAASSFSTVTKPSEQAPAADSNAGVSSHSEPTAAAAMGSGEQDLSGQKRKSTGGPAAVDDNSADKQTGDDSADKQPAKRPYTRVAPTPNELKARVDELVKKVDLAESERQRAQDEVAQLEQETHDMQQLLGQNGDKIIQLQHAVATRDATLLHTQQELATLKVEVEDRGHQLETFGVEVENMEAKERHLSGHHPEDIKAKINQDLKNEYAGKLGEKEIKKRKKQRGVLAVDVKAKEEALQRDALQLADLRVKFAFLNGPQAKRDRKALKAIKQREKIRTRKLKVNARAKREVRKLTLENARAMCDDSEGDESYSGSGSDSGSSENEYDLNDGFLVPDNEEEDNPQPMEMEA